MLNLIWLFNPNFAFQSCRTPPDCNYTFLYLSIMGTSCYMLIYNYLRLSKTLPHEFFTNKYQVNTLPRRCFLQGRYLAITGIVCRSI